MKHYELAFKQTNELDLNITELENRSNSLLEHVDDQSDKIKQTQNAIDGIENQRKSINEIASKVEGVTGNIPEIMKRLEEITNAKGQVAELETRLQQLNAETERKIALFQIVSDPRKRGKQSAKLTDRVKSEISELHEKYNYPVDKIASFYNISVSEVQGILDQVFA